MGVDEVLLDLHVRAVPHRSLDHRVDLGGGAADQLAVCPPPSWLALLATFMVRVMAGAGRAGDGATVSTGRAVPGQPGGRLACWWPR